MKIEHIAGTFCRVVLVAATVGLTAALASGTAASAAQNAVIGTEPFEEAFPNPCTGETVLLTGELHVISHQSTDRAGGYHEKFTVVPRGVTGTGASGTRYLAVGSHSDVFNTGPGRATTFTLTVTFNVISTGGNGNFVSTVTVHLTENANGESTAEVESFRTRCVG